VHPAIMIDTFIYEAFYTLTGRGPVITGKVMGDSSKVKPGMFLSVGGDRFLIVGVEAFRPLRPTQPIGLLVKGVTQECINNFSQGDEFSVLEEK